MHAIILYSTFRGFVIDLFFYSIGVIMKEGGDGGGGYFSQGEGVGNRDSKKFAKILRICSTAV
jgi:hypothetical protein